MAPFLLDNAASTPPLKWVMAALAAGTILYVLIRPKMTRRKDPLDRGPAMTSLSQQRSVERQMQNLLVELSEMARQITGQLDTRAAKLQLLIAEADERLAALAEAKRTAAIALPVVPVVPPPASFAELRPAPAPEPAAAAEVDVRHQQVYSLHDQGRTSFDIARELNRPRNEVELIIALRSHA